MKLKDFKNNEMLCKNYFKKMKDDEFYPATQISKDIGITSELVRHYAEKLKIPSIKLSHKMIFGTKKAIEWIKSNGGN